MDFLELLGLSLAPGIAISIFIYLKDKHEREPFLLLFICFLYGVVSLALTLAVSWPVEKLIALKDDDVVDQFYNAFFKVAFIEELSKFVFVRFILYYNKNFNEPFDGIVYSVMVGMGFATLENIVYVFGGEGISTGIMRMFTAVPAHATFAILMGYFLGRAKFDHNRVLRLSIFALVAATIFHGAYDYFLFISSVSGVWTGIWILAVVSLVIAFVLSRKAIRLHQDASPFIQAALTQKEERTEGVDQPGE